MQDSKHTPGPWKIDRNTVYALTETRIYGKPVPVNRFWASVYAGEQCSQEEAQANAALIARAPELVEDNARLRELLRECLPFIPYPNMPYRKFTYAETMLASRIKAAIGE